MSTDHDEMPARYRPDDLGTASVTESGHGNTAHVPIAPATQLDVTPGDVVSCLPHDTDAIMLHPGQRTGAIASYQVGKPTAADRQASFSVCGPVLDYFGATVGDTIRFEYTTRDAPRVIARLVTPDVDASPQTTPFETPGHVGVSARHSAGQRRIYHTRECRYVRRSERLNAWPRETAEAWGFTQCTDCQEGDDAA